MNLIYDVDKTTQIEGFNRVAAIARSNATYSPVHFKDYSIEVLHAVSGRCA